MNQAFDCIHRDYEISFEANFLEEHEEAFKNLIQNFMESIFKSKKDETCFSSAFFNKDRDLATFSLDNEEVHNSEGVENILE